MKLLGEGHVEWTMPAPLWEQAGDPSVEENRVRFRTPVLLRFATDTFMDDFLTVLNTQPDRLQEFVAAPEAWNLPPGEPAKPIAKSGMMLTLFRARAAAVRKLQAQGRRVLGETQSSPETNKKGLKLYQPAHQRYYLVTACLVCRVLGLPDRKIDAGAEERATFVLRMLEPGPNADSQNPAPRDCTELALVNGAWQKVNEPQTLSDGEEQRPLSPAAFRQDDGRRRRLLIGLIPVGDRERMLQAARTSPVAGATVLDSRQMLLKTRVIYPMKTLEDSATAAYNLATAPPPSNVGSGLSSPDKQTIIDRANDLIQQMSWYILLDLAKYFETYLGDLWQEINSQGDGQSLSPELKAIWQTLSQTTFSTTTLFSALRQAYQASATLESVKTSYSTKTSGGTSGWPSFAFRFYTATLMSGPKPQQLSPELNRDTLEGLIVKALPELDPHPQIPVRAVAQASANPQTPVWFTIRCVLERPNCGTLTPPLVSEPTAAFQMAAFFDPDAPARPIRIGMPVDTTPAGLRKFDKNTAFVMSDTLCGQVRKMGSMGFVDLIMSVLPFPLHKDLDGGSSPCSDNGVPGGMVCSFSIPIITICALILLIIFVKLLDIIFFWMPFFQICLPLPNFTAKESQ